MLHQCLLLKCCITACCACRGEAELSGVWAKFLVLGLGLLFLGKQEVVEPTLEVRARAQLYSYSLSSGMHMQIVSLHT
jgi:hypothetical protein